MQVALEKADIDALASSVAQRIAQIIAKDCWMNAEQAAEHLSCPVSRIRKLTMTNDLPSHKEGRRRLYRRSELDAFVVNGGGNTH
jgi:excisionase family DNA binding protein